MLKFIKKILENIHYSVDIDHYDNFMNKQIDNYVDQISQSVNKDEDIDKLIEEYDDVRGVHTMSVINDVVFFKNKRQEIAVPVASLKSYESNQWYPYDDYTEVRHSSGKYSTFYKHTIYQDIFKNGREQYNKFEEWDDNYISKFGGSVKKQENRLNRFMTVFNRKLMSDLRIEKTIVSLKYYNITLTNNHARDINILLDEDNYNKFKSLV